MRSFRWFAIGLGLTLAALTLAACGTQRTSVATPPLSTEHPTFIFFYTEG